MDKEILPLLICIYCNKEDEDFELHVFKQENNEVVDAILYCPSCHRYYMILDTVVYMTKDSDRIKKDEHRFLKLYEKELPDHVKKNMKPS
ncbi:MAG: hypothetical protein ACXADA_24905 [Candidatus Hodarchaeales archaeon]|jgi:uncharacterized protein YbaR (Trm112 family)